MDGGHPNFKKRILERAASLLMVAISVATTSLNIEAETSRGAYDTREQHLLEAIPKVSVVKEGLSR
jgi:hypothetical protein